MPFVEKYVDILYRFRWAVLVVWILLVCGTAYPATQFINITTQEVSNPTDTPSAHATDQMEVYFPGSSTTTNVIAFIQSKSKKGDILEGAYVQNFSTALCSSVYRYKPVVPKYCMSYYSLPVGIREGFISPDNNSAIVTMQVDTYFLSPVAYAFTDYVSSTLGTTDEILGNGYTVHLAGLSLFMNELISESSRELGMMDAIVLPIAMIVLAYFVRSARLIIMPICSIALTASVAFGSMYGVGQFVKINAIAPSLMMSVMIAMSIDYALFLLTRYREELIIGMRGIPCVVRVLQTAGHTITVSGFTLGLCFMSLCFCKEDMLISVGVGNAVVLFIILAINLSFLPALLLTFEPFFEKCVPDDKKHAKRDVSSSITGGQDITDQLVEALDYKNTRYYKFGLVITRKPWNILLVLLVVGLTIPFDLHSIGFLHEDAFVQYMPRNTDTTHAYVGMMNTFGAGYMYPYRLLVVPRNASATPILSASFFDDTYTIFHDMFSNPRLPQTSPSVVTGIMIQKGERVSYDVFHACKTNFSVNPQCPAYEYLSFGMVAKDQRATWVSIVLPFDPTGPQGDPWYRTALDLLAGYSQQYPYDFYLEGTGATSMDAIDYVYDRFTTMVWITGLIVFICIVASFRSLLIALRAVVTIALTLSWVYGFGALVYQHGLLSWVHLACVQGVGGVVWAIPVISFAIVVGIGLDYDIFLLSRTMEFVSTKRSATQTIVLGLSTTGTIITAAGIIMAIAFSGLMLSSIAVINELGFYMVAAVLFDTFIVRTCLVPSIMSLFGAWNWWPRIKMSKARGSSTMESLGDREEGALVTNV